MSGVLVGVARVGSLQSVVTQGPWGPTEARHFSEGLEKSIIQNNMLFPKSAKKSANMKYNNILLYI